MQSKKQNLRKLLAVALIIVSLLLLSLNRGFNYTSYSPSYVVNTKGELKLDVVNELARQSGSAKVDRDNGLVYFQGLTTAQFNQMVTELQEKYKSQAERVQITSYLETPTPLFVAGSDQFVFALSVILLGYLLYRFLWQKFERSDRLKIAGSVVISMLASGLVLLGVVSTVSVVTMVSEFTIYLAVLAEIVLLLIVVQGLAATAVTHPTGRADSTIMRVGKDFDQLAKHYGRYLIVGTLVLMVALGYRFVLDGLIFVIGYILAAFVFSTTLLLWYKVFTFKWSRPKPKKRRS